VHRGLGLGPNPLLHQTKSCFNSINKIKPYSLRNTMGRLVSQALPKHYPRPEVVDSTPVESQNFYHLPTTRGVPRGTPRLGHVAPYHLPKIMTHVITGLVHLSANVCPVSMPTHLSCHCTTVWSATTPTLYGLYSQQNFACLEK
jgi:hypothetical protein